MLLHAIPLPHTCPVRRIWEKTAKRKGVGGQNMKICLIFFESIFIFLAGAHPYFYTRQTNSFKYPIFMFPHKPHIFCNHLIDYPKRCQTNIKNMRLMKQYEAESPKNAS